MPLSKAEERQLEDLKGDWADADGSWYTVIRDQNGYGETASVRIWRRRGEVIFRKGIIRFSQGGGRNKIRYLVWGRDTPEGSYFIDATSATSSYVYWERNGRGKGFAWTRPEGAHPSGKKWSDEELAAEEDQGQGWDEPGWEGDARAHPQGEWEEKAWGEGWSKAAKQPAGKASDQWWKDLGGRAESRPSGGDDAAGKASRKAEGEAAKGTPKHSPVPGSPSTNAAGADILRMVNNGTAAGSPSKEHTAVVTQAWPPASSSGEASIDSSVLTLQAGAEVQVLWWQPPEEGGYWVYGESNGARGYFPAACIQNPGAIDGVANPSMAPPPGLFHGRTGAPASTFAATPAERSRYMCANPNCWYAVNASPEYGGFCCRRCFQRHSTGKKGGKAHGPQCTQQEAPSGAPRAPPDPPPERMEGPAGSPATASSAGKASGEPAAASPVLEALQQAVPCLRRRSPEVTPEQRAAADAPKNLPASNSNPRRSAPKNPAPVPPTAVSCFSHVAPVGVIEGPYTVIWAWTAMGEGQLGLQPGQPVMVSWWQPQADGGFWAYGYEMNNGQAGYFPISCIARAMGPL